MTADDLDAITDVDDLRNMVRECRQRILELEDARAKWYERAQEAENAISLRNWVHDTLDEIARRRSESE